MSGNWHKRGNIKGADGVGVPEGGQPGQSLQKVGNSDFATAWAFPEYKDIVGKVPKSALPDIGNSTVPVSSESAMLNLPAVVGNMAIRTDIGKTFVLAEEPASVLANWVELVTASDVVSVNGKTGNVQLDKADVGLSNVNNTADADKPVATKSVPGLMSAADKTKLDNATSSATGSRMAIRDSAGRISFKQVSLSEAPTSSGHAATKSYVDDLHGQSLSFKGWIGDGVDLNTIIEPGVYYQKTAPTKPSALNYPEGLANLQGTLIVTNYYGTISTPVQTFIAVTGSSNADIYGMPRIATRSSWNSGANWGGWGIDATTKFVQDQIDAGTKPANFQLRELQGGQKLTKTIPTGVGWQAGTLSDDWDQLRSYAQTGLVEGWVKGCPVGGAVSLTTGISDGFVKDPVWKLEVRPEGLNYVTQRATLLNCIPAYMIGFSWERIYNPATAKWGAWTCVGGDSGPINSVKSTSSTATPSQPLLHQQNSKTELYTPSSPYLIRRQGPMISLSGAAGSSNADMQDGSGKSAVSLGYMVLAANSSATNPGADYTLHWGHLGAYEFDSVQQGSGSDKWFMRRGGPGYADFTAERYSGNVSGRKWMPFSKVYQAPPVNTYTGPGFVPPPMDAQSGTPGD